jgi:hypothetical protein
MKRTTPLRHPLALLLCGVALGGCADLDPSRALGPAEPSPAASPDGLDATLRAYLARHGFTGRIASTLETRLGRRVDLQLADIGRHCSGSIRSRA